MLAIWMIYNFLPLIDSWWLIGLVIESDGVR
jgi:hypothetical protein